MCRPSPDKDVSLCGGQVLKRQHQDHWLGVRMHNSEKFTLKMRRFRSRLNTLLTLSAPPAKAA